MSNNPGKKVFNVLIVSIVHDPADDFLGVITSENNNELMIGSHRIVLDVFAGVPSEDPSFKDRIAKVDAIAVLVRFLDVLSLDKIRDTYHYLAQAGAVPKAILYLRDKGEMDFKISCPSCGQKLWLRDAEVGKRGRCPNCSKPFVISSQADHLRAQLLLAESMPCLKVVSKDADSFRTAVVKILEVHASGVITADAAVNLEALKHATVPIQVQEP